MRVADQDYRSIWLDSETGRVKVIDQSELPHRFVVRDLDNLEDAAEAIAVMRVRGAPLIGATAAHGFALAVAEDASDAALDRAFDHLLRTRPTAVNLRWALEKVRTVTRAAPLAARAEHARRVAVEICEEDVESCRSIGEHGLGLLRELAEANSGRPLNILTHCNAGWLATVDWGTALAPIYAAHAAGIPVHIWVDETRPRNQGASLTGLRAARNEDSAYGDRR